MIDCRTATRKKLVGDVLRERDEQDAQWGGEDTDDSRNTFQWAVYIEKQVNKMRVADGQPPQKHAALVKIAALALAALESLEREL